MSRFVIGEALVFRLGLAWVVEQLVVIHLHVEHEALAAAVPGHARSDCRVVSDGGERVIVEPVYVTRTHVEPQEVVGHVGELAGLQVRNAVGELLHLEPLPAPAVPREVDGLAVPDRLRMEDHTVEAHAIHALCVRAHERRTRFVPPPLDELLAGVNLRKPRPIRSVGTGHHQQSQARDSA